MGLQERIVLDVSLHLTVMPASDMDCVLECLPSDGESILKKQTRKSSKQVVASGLIPWMSSKGETTLQLRCHVACLMA